MWGLAAVFLDVILVEGAATVAAKGKIRPRLFFHHGVSPVFAVSST